MKKIINRILIVAMRFVFFPPLWGGLGWGFFISCEEEVKLDIPSGKGKIVVEGHIEQDLPPYIILTRTTSFFSELNVQEYEKLFVHNAIITVSGGDNSIQLKEYCSNDLNDTVRYLLSEFLGISSLDTNLNVNFCFYSTDPLFPFPMVGKTNKRYDLQIKVDNEVLNSTTTIPYQLSLDSLWYETNANPKDDQLVLLWARYDDPDTLGNYVRYFTSRNGGQFFPGYFGSVFDDRFFNGESFPFTLDRGQSKSEEPDFHNSTYGYFWKGDTIIVKWCAIDAPHYIFWRTVEQEFGSTGNPFSTPTIIETNIKGGIGIWGGYSVFYDTLIVPK